MFVSLRGAARAAALGAGAVLVTSCTVHAHLKPFDPAPPAELAIEKTAGEADSIVWPEMDWWSALGDSQLSALVDEGLKSSPSLEVAQARLAAAEARASSAASDRLPGIESNIGSSRSRYSENGFFPPPLGGMTLWEHKASVDFRWDLDFWGRQRSALRAALREADAAMLDRNGAALSLSVAIARRYVEWQHLEDQLEIARGLIRQREQLLDLTRKRVRAGLDTNVELRQAEAAVPDARVDASMLETQISLVRFELAALIGAGPDRGLSLRPPEISSPAFSAGLPTVIPADLLARRSDVTASRLRVEAAAARADFARADTLPNINLAGNFGFDSVTLDDWFEGGSRFFNVGPALRLPIFNTGRRTALRLRTTEYDEAAADYRQTLIDAVHDVAAALFDLRAIESERQDAQAAVTAQSSAYEIARHRYEAGLDAFTQVLLAEARLLNQRRRIADLDARRLDASIRLVAALGGGMPQYNGS